MITEVPHVVVLSGSPAAGSRTARLGEHLTRLVEGRRATAVHLGGPDLDLPFYRPGAERGFPAARLLREVTVADGLVLVSPAYNGGVSGLLKNALDHLADLADDSRPFLDGRSVGCVAVAGGGQGASAVLLGMRSAVHALRGWPTPLGVTVCPAPGADPRSDPADEPAVRRQLETLADQVVDFARAHAAYPVPRPVRTPA